jgi:hypothetical protein
MRPIITKTLAKIYELIFVHYQTTMLGLMLACAICLPLYLFEKITEATFLTLFLAIAGIGGLMKDNFLSPPNSNNQNQM